MDDALMREAELARDQLNQLEVAAERGRLEFHQAIRRLHSAGPSMRDIASVLGLSHQRVHQIVSGGKEMASPTGRANILDRLVRRRRKDCEPARGSIRLQELLPNRFDVGAREAVSLAEEEARSLNHAHLGTEHLLLGLLRTEHGLAARLLRSAGVDLDQSRRIIANMLGTAPSPRANRLSSTARLKQVLELAYFEAKRTRSTHVRTEHLLLGLAREGRGLGARVLSEFGVGYEHIDARISRAAVACSFCGRSGLDVAHLIAGPGVFICNLCVDAVNPQRGQGEVVQGSATPLTVVPRNDPVAACSFCGKRVGAVDRLVTIDFHASICTECLAICHEIQDAERESQRPGRG